MTKFSPQIAHRPRRNPLNFGVHRVQIDLMTSSNVKVKNQVAPISSIFCRKGALNTSSNHAKFHRNRFSRSRVMKGQSSKIGPIAYNGKCHLRHIVHHDCRVASTFVSRFHTSFSRKTLNLTFGRAPRSKDSPKNLSQN